MRGGRLQVEDQLAAQFGTATVDTSDWLCTPQACPVVIGDLLVYRDRNHLTPDASAFLAPLLEAALVPLVGQSSELRRGAARRARPARRL